MVELVFATKIEGPVIYEEKKKLTVILHVDIIKVYMTNYGYVNSILNHLQFISTETFVILY